MKKIAKIIDQRPYYYHEQLLLADDFLAEQNYHVGARRRHNLKLHGWGIVDGLSVERASDASVLLRPGAAVDPNGAEIVLEQSEEIHLKEFNPGEELRIEIAYEDNACPQEDADEPKNRRNCCLSIAITSPSEARVGVLLATLKLDSEGKVDQGLIDLSQADRLRRLAPGSVTAGELHPSLKRGWLRMPLRPVPLVNKPEGVEEIPPPFRVGATQAMTPDPKDAGDKDRGAAGTMDIPVPPRATAVTGLRLAGPKNEGQVRLQLFVGGWDNNNGGKHRKDPLLTEDPKKTEIIKSAPFDEAFPIANGKLDPEYSTLSLWVMGTKRTAISLVAVEFEYY